ncbi:Methyltransferase-like protein 22 [Mortierella sp. GBA30]|nr:Methyltransferase-like protein 22 [Mortierella sp. GBA30]
MSSSWRADKHYCDIESEVHPYGKKSRPHPNPPSSALGINHLTQIEPETLVDALNDEDASNGTEDEDEEVVLSEVHIHPANGRVDGRLMTSVFLLSRNNQDLKTEHSPEDHEENEDLDSEEWDYALEIQHAMGTTLRGVGSQVWMGSFLLVDYLMAIKDQLDEAVVLELGAGTGLASIALGLVANLKMAFCTDYDTEILTNCETNIVRNGQNVHPDDPETVPLETRVKARRLNWLMEQPMESIEEQHDRFDWSEHELEEWKANGAYIIAADVVYDDSLTDALVDCLEKLLCEPLADDHPRRAAGRVAYLTMEKRYNFSLEQLDVVAQAHDYFVKRMERSKLIEAQRIDCTGLGRYCDYERSKDLVRMNAWVLLYFP